MIYLRGIISKKNLDHNNHTNISMYVKFADESNDKLIKKIYKKKKLFFVAKKTFIENKSELLIREKWKIKSLLIKVGDYHIVTRHEIYNDSKNKLSANCFFYLVPLYKIKKKIYKFEKSEKRALKKKIRIGYMDPFKWFRLVYMLESLQV